MADRAVRIDAGGATLDGDLSLPPGAPGVVLFAHGSGSSRHSPRNRRVAAELQRRGLGTLLIDLLTADEERVDATTGHLRFDIGLLARRLAAVVDWLDAQDDTRGRPVGLFGASTGGGAALVAAADRPAGWPRWSPAGAGPTSRTRRCRGSPRRRCSSSGGTTPWWWA